MELFPLDVRGELSGVANCLVNLCTFLNIKTYPTLSEESILNVYGTFWLYAAVCMLGCVYGIWFLPETKGKRLEEINKSFMNKKALDQYDAWCL